MPDFQSIINRIDDAIAAFVEKVPTAQRDMLNAIDDELSRLETSNGKIKTTVKNLKIITSIKNKLLRVILTDEYKGQVRDFVQAFRDITTLHNQYWRSVEKTFKPTSLLKQVRQIAISDTISKLTEAGLESRVVEPVKDILRQNITQGGSMRDLRNALRTQVQGAPDAPGLLEGHVKQITTDSINQYSRNYTQIVTSDLGLEWYGYRNTLIKTSRPFCRAMAQRRYFHVSEIPDLLKARGLFYKNPKSGKIEKVPLYVKTGLPEGMYATTNVANFLTLLGGYNCGHQIGPVSELLVKRQAPELYNKVTLSAQYKAWKTVNGA